MLVADFLKEVIATIDLTSNKMVTKYGSFSVNKSSEVAKMRVATDIPTKELNNNELFIRCTKLYTGDEEPYGFCDKVKHEMPVKNDRVTISVSRG